MSEWEYAVRILKLTIGNDPASALEEALTAESGDGWELVSCFAQPVQSGRSPTHELPIESEETNPYDAVWTDSVDGHSYVAVFKRSR